MYRWFERYFAFSRKEINGICVLGGLLGLLWLVAYLLPLWDSRHPSDLTDKIEEIERFLASAEVWMDVQVPERSDAIEYFPFDPNRLTAADGRRLGLSDRQMRMIENYWAKGGRFREKADLAKIYAIDEADYARLEPYIRIPADERPVEPKPQVDRSVLSVVRDEADRNPRLALSMELNSADSIQLQQLPGIGPVFASRIVRFRNGLGGFHRVTQLLDVYGMDTARFEQLKGHVYVDSNQVARIDLNLADYERLRNHPLISPKLANAMVQYRRQHGPYRSLTDLLRIVLMDEEIFRKIAPYLTISDD